MNPIKIEKGATEAIKRIVRLHEMMDESLNEADKNPSWDGHIFLYFDSDLRVEHLLYKIPVQVKGKNKEDLLNKERITYPVEFKYLRNYFIDGGVIYFVVAISNDGEETVVFYNDLTLSKLQLLLKGTKNKKPNQTKSISLSRLKDNNKNELYKILLQFGCNCQGIQEIEQGKIDIALKRISEKENYGHEENISHINRIEYKILNLIQVVTDNILNENEELKILTQNNMIKILPSCLDIASFLGIRVVYEKMPRENVSYLNLSSLTINVSTEYIENKYITSILVARELGHFFLHDSMHEILDYNSCLPIDIIKEYDANVFAIMLMPDIMAGEPWLEYSPIKLNKIMYDKIKKNK